MHSTLSEHRRLTILKFLKDAPEYTSNSSILAEICNKFGVPSTNDQVAGEIAWLNENGLISYEDHGGFMIVCASQRGVEVASGQAAVPGVRRPRPKV